MLTKDQPVSNQFLKQLTESSNTHLGLNLLMTLTMITETLMQR